MSEVTEQFIKNAIRSYKQTCLQQHLLQSRLSNHEIPSTEIQNNALSQMIMRNQTVEGWLSILSEDEAFVIRKHLMEELDWPRIEAEHRDKWGEFGKTESTLKRYQKRALEKIICFMQNQQHNDDR